MDMESTKLALMELEEEGWAAIKAGRGDHYREICLDDCLMVESDGVATWRDFLDEVDGKPAPFERYDLKDAKMVPLNDTGAVLTYHANAEVEGRGSFDLYMTSVYILEGTNWKLAFHQQTPAADG